MKWWRDARFGMFIHWGLYAVPAGEWKGQTNHAEWIRESAHIPIEQYDQFRQKFPTAKSAYVRVDKAVIWDVIAPLLSTLGDEKIQPLMVTQPDDGKPK